MSKRANRWFKFGSALLLSLVAIAFTYTAIARSPVSWPGLPKASTATAKGAEGYIYIKKVKAVCHACKKDAKAYNKLAKKINLLVAELEGKLRAIQSDELIIRGEEGEYYRLVSDAKTARLGGPRLKIINKKLAGLAHVGQALGRMKANRNRIHAIRKELAALQSKVNEAYGAFKHCQSIGCPADTTSLFLPPVTIDCRREPCKSYIKDYNNRLKKLAELEHQMHALERKRNALGSSATRAEKIPVVMAIARLRPKINDLKNAFRGESGLRKIVLACVKIHCGHDLVLPPIDDPDHPMSMGGGRISFGAAGTFGVSQRHSSVVHSDELQATARTMAGIGFGLVAQYYLMMHPAWFLYTSLVYPGDHSATLLNTTVAAIPTRLRLVKQLVFSIAIARQILQLSHHSSLSLGLGLSATRQKLTLNADESGGSFSSSNHVTTVTPMAFTEFLYPLAHHLAFLSVLSMTYLPNMNYTTAGPAGTAYHMHVRDTLELSLMLGLKYSFAPM